MIEQQQTQLDIFREAARNAGKDKNETAWEARLTKTPKPKSVEKPA